MNIDRTAKEPGRRLPAGLSALVLAMAVSAAADAAGFSAFYEFPHNGGLGNDPAQMAMIEATDGNYYGTTRAGGTSGGCCGTVYKITPSGQLSQLWAFACDQNGNCPDGRSPDGGVVQASDGNFYGLTSAGGAYNDGTIYRITSSGALTTLYNFCWYPSTCGTYSGGTPEGSLIQASNGYLYGTSNAGTAYRISLKGKFKLLYTWPTGGGPWGALVQASNGRLYGTTSGGGAKGLGSIFTMTVKGKVTTLYSFGSQSNCADGQEPLAGLVQARSGDLYGTTFVGGATGCGGYGTVFKITQRGKFTSLVSFQCGATPCNPSAPLALAADGTLYGTTQNGGQNNN
jgi:uncharacterized repeat protein (TIGR03803 family)